MLYQAEPRPDTVTGVGLSYTRSSAGYRSFRDRVRGRVQFDCVLGARVGRHGTCAEAMAEAGKVGGALPCCERAQAAAWDGAAVEAEPRIFLRAGVCGRV